MYNCIVYTFHFVWPVKFILCQYFYQNTLIPRINGWMSYVPTFGEFRQKWKGIYLFLFCFFYRIRWFLLLFTIFIARSIVYKCSQKHSYCTTTLSFLLSVFRVLLFSLIFLLSSFFFSLLFPVILFKCFWFLFSMRENFFFSFLGKKLFS